MSTLTYPAVITAGTTADATQVESNFTAIQTVVNGNLEASTNVKVFAPQALVGGANAQGSSNGLARADHIHVVRAMEILAADPATGNFVGREYFNSATLKKRLCISAAGSGTWVTGGNLSAADLPAHAGNHTPQGAGTDLFDPPSCVATRSGTQNFNNTIIGPINWTGSDMVNNDNMHSNVTNNSRILLTRAGLWYIWLTVMWTGNTTGDRVASVQLNAAGAGSGRVLGADARQTPTGGAVNAVNQLSLLYFAAGTTDYVEGYLWQNSGNALTIIGNGATGAALGTGAGICAMGAVWQGSGV